MHCEEHTHLCRTSCPSGRSPPHRRYPAAGARAGGGRAHRSGQPGRREGLCVALATRRTWNTDMPRAPLHAGNTAGARPGPAETQPACLSARAAGGGAALLQLRPAEARSMSPAAADCPCLLEKRPSSELWTSTSARRLKGGCLITLHHENTRKAHRKAHR
jgi:hypothetical protein